MRRAARFGEPRAGMLVCVCDPQLDVPANDNRARPVPRFALVLGFAFAVLAQTLASGLLPMAGALLAPVPALTPVPFAAMMAGALLASFPASFLGDTFGRRTGFALGASLGIAGGLLLAVGLMQRQFVWVCLAALWLGMAQGFSFFYRHEAAASAGRPSAAAAGVLAGGVLAALAGPSLAGGAEWLFAPFFLVGSALLAALAHTCGLAVAVWYAPNAAVRVSPARPAPLRAILIPTVVGALAWGGMSFVMADAPLALMGCGIGEGAVFGFLALHVAAMYVPAAGLAFVANRLPAPLLAVGGMLLVAAAIPLMLGGETLVLTVGLVMVGAGWSVATVGCTGWLYADRPPSRLALALHDGALFGAAILGALASGRLL